jgi:hypothetical protein
LHLAQIDQLGLFLPMTSHCDVYFAVVTSLVKEESTDVVKKVANISYRLNGFFLQVLSLAFFSTVRLNEVALELEPLHLLEKITYLIPEIV